MHGAPAYGGYQTGGSDVALGIAKQGLEGILGRRLLPKRSLGGTILESLGGLGCRRGQRGGPRGPRESNGGARQTLRTVWSGGHVCPRAYETLHIWNMESRGENVSRIRMRQTLRTARYFEHESLGAHHVVHGAL